MATSSTPSPYQSGTPATTGVGEGNFFTSRKNKVGMSLAALVIILHVILIMATGVGLGFLWPVVAVAAWGAGVALTPPSAPKAIAAPAPTEPINVQLNRDVRNTLRELVRAKPPERVLNQASELEDNMRFILDEWDELQSTPEHQQTVWNIVKIYLPEVVNTYVNAPQYHSAEAAAVMEDSLSTLTGALERIKLGVVDHSLRTMDSQARTLRETFGNLPGLDQT
ncbi:hypothetical protein [Corynebacterium sp. CCUG 65737]|uniref:hypothetical protein n=1 Tax=Corynebacterium sp. CCUG 65737 TaxID=2823889 RepID=UPI00210B045D